MSATTIFRRNFLILSRCLLNNFNNNGHFNKISSREGVRILNNNNINNKYNFINSKNIRFIHGLVDKDLSTQLAEELTYYEKEKDTIATSSTSTKDDVKNGKEIPSIMTKSISVSFNNFNWELFDKRTLNEVYMTREYNNEKIRVLFNIIPLEYYEKAEEEDEDEEEDEEDEDEDEDEIEERKVDKSTIPPATIIPEEDKDEEDLIDSSDEEFEEQSPEKTLRCAITIEKKDKGVLAFEALAREGRFLIENVSFYEALQTNHTKSAIPFPNLSANFRHLFTKYLEYRGINEELSQYILRYSTHKENQEYIIWLENVKKFIDS
ncbi:mitochondrial glyco protein [Rhizophagus irregularis]|uniref:Mitochondrial glyco protein n=1 Tax=Rhizophagus irregularis TaxID=588596 RepID=A0A2N0RDB1_9GLOM|nr:mitochondrial glyco protein [Rhizophagus irregularis]PKC61276.1 mitochondrial glyco protein [Rhizophagus irregularis]CAB4493865.1 unnamed protein product [Rhizophagus irregularis]CAB5370173.1 unnamed protein product [Rhizophagus irregularis]